MDFLNINSQKGLSLIEVLLAVALIILVVSALVTLGVTALRTADAGRARAVAAELTKEAIEAARAKRDQDSSGFFALSGYKTYSGGSFGSTTCEPSSPTLNNTCKVTTATGADFYRIIKFEPSPPPTPTKSIVTAYTFWNQHGSYPKIVSSTYLTKWR